MELLEYDNGDRVPNRGRKPLVIALHCSGAASWEWQILDSYIGERFSLIAPNLIGNDGGERWPGTHEFKLSDEAAPIVNSIDAVEGPVHLVGHSYGGAVALRCAIEPPYKIASLTLYEPAAFHPEWWLNLRRVLRPGGLLVVDNATFPNPAELAPFVALVKADAAFFTSLVPVGNGEFLAVRSSN
jgi:pimeloyl-ACP methyl ester carboxylesterase